MKQLINKENSGLNTQNAIAYGASFGTMLGGTVAAHIALKLAKQDKKLAVNGALALAGLAGAMTLKHPLAKFACLGAASYGALKTLNLAVAEVVAPASAAEGQQGVLAGIGALLPENLKAKVREFLPNIGDIGIGYVAPNLLGEDELLNGALAELGLDDTKEEILNGIGTETEFEEVSGVGRVGKLNLALL
ncbi:MAG: hypothetical protein KF900_14005 [Bacteroidetes bacterium]|nr:hypothetical protein [Bacteroidota bacterium]